jgi:outer membrane protein TolC
MPRRMHLGARSLRRSRRTAAAPLHFATIDDPASASTEIALAEFQAGTVDYTAVALAEETQSVDQQNELSVQQGRLLDAVSLIGDLGGGWSDEQLHDPRHPSAPR